MKSLILFGAIIIMLLTVSCQADTQSGQGKLEDLPETKTFAQLTNSEKESVIISSVREAISDHTEDLEFRNYDFLLEYHNKLRPCPENPHSIRVYLNEEVSAESSLYLFQSYEFLKPDKEFGELGLYGIKFEINSKTGSVEKFYAYTNFTKWSKGKPGSRESKGSKFIEYDTGEVPDIRDKYGDNELIAATDLFYRTEMKTKQDQNKNKCK